MQCFEELFIESKGKPITFKGKILQMMDVFPVLSGERLKIFFESVNSEWRQGIALKTKGSFIMNEKKFKSAIVFWQDNAPPTFELSVITKIGQIEIKNVWDTGDGTIHSWHNGAAIIVEELANGRRYHCNDGHPDDDFTDIIFRVERATVVANQNSIR